MFVRERNERQPGLVWTSDSEGKSGDTPACSSAGGPSPLSQPQVAVEMQGGREGGGCREMRLLAAFNEVPLK